MNENFTFEVNIFFVFSELAIYATIPAQEPNGSIIITNSSITNGSITYGCVPLDTSSTYDQLDQAKIQWWGLHNYNPMIDWQLQGFKLLTPIIYSIQLVEILLYCYHSSVSYSSFL